MDDKLVNPEGNGQKAIPSLFQQEIGVILRIKYSSYLVPCRSGNDKRSNQTELAAFVAPTGERFIPVFTEQNELDGWPYGHDKAMHLSFDDLKNTVLNDRYKLSGIIIDPFSKMIFLRQKQIELIDLIPENAGIHNVKHSKDVQMSKPVQDMPKLIEALMVFFSGCENVYKAYTLMVKEPTDSKPHLLVVVDFDGNESNFFPSLAKVICESLNQGEAFEMMKATYDLLKMVMPICDPMYKKAD